MTCFPAYKTSDGQIFESQKDALRHADNRYGNALTSLAHKLVQIEKYKDMVPFLEENLHLFMEVSALKQDCELIEDGDEE